MAATLKAKYQREFGNENVGAGIALFDKEDECAIALVNAAETSKDANHRLSAIYVKALIAVEWAQKEEDEKEYERIVLFDPEIKTEKDAKKEMNYPTASGRGIQMESASLNAPKGQEIKPSLLSSRPPKRTRRGIRPNTINWI